MREMKKSYVFIDGRAVNKQSKYLLGGGEGRDTGSLR